VQSSGSLPGQDGDVVITAGIILFTMLITMILIAGIAAQLLNLAGNTAITILFQLINNKTLCAHDHDSSLAWQQQ